MRSVSRAELIRFLFYRLGLRGPPWEAANAPAAADLGMIQIDSIRVTGLRNHDLAWIARSDAPLATFSDAIYAHGLFRESHLSSRPTRPRSSGASTSPCRSCMTAMWSACSMPASIAATAARSGRSSAWT